jgi:hypothetical protein
MKAIKSSLLLSLAAVLVLLGACADQMQPAKQALDGAASAVGTAAPDASQYDPDKLTTLKNRLADLQAAFDRKDYSTVLSSAPGIVTDANALAQEAASKKQAAMAAMAAQWDTVSASVPKLLTAVKARVDALGKSRHVPKDIDLSAGKSALADATSLWEKAQNSHTDGKPADAVKAAKDAATKLQEAAAALNLKLPDQATRN